MDNELGKFLEELRGKMSLRKAAEKSGLSHTYIRDLELGVNRVTKTPIKVTPESLKKLSEAYNYSYDDLMKKAGYIETSDATELINSFLIHIADNYPLNEEEIRNVTDPPYTGDMIPMKELLMQMSLEDKLDWFMTITDNFRNVAYVSDPEGTGRLDFVVKPVKIDLEDNDILDVMDLTYKGMPLTKSEKIEFLSIARAIFDARRALKGKD